MFLEKKFWGQAEIKLDFRAGVEQLKMKKPRKQEKERKVITKETLNTRR